MFDDDTALNAPHPAVKDVATAGGSEPIKGEGSLFARISGASVLPGGATIIIRAKALFVPTLKSDNLLPISKLTDASVIFENNGTDYVARATVNFTDVAGTGARVSSLEEDGVFPLQLSPLSKDEASRYRGLFP